MRIVVKNLTSKHGHPYYRKAVPEDIRDLVGKTSWEHSLKDKTQLESIADAEVLNKVYAGQIREMRSNSASLLDQKKTTEQFVKDHPELLDTEPHPEHGYSQAELAWGELTEEWESKHPEGPPKNKDYLPPFLRALERTIANGGDFLPTSHALSSIYQYYVETRSGGVPDQVTKSAYSKALKYFDDREISNIRRRDVLDWVKDQEKTCKASTIKRQVNSLNAMVNHYLRDFELGRIANPFSKLNLASSHSDTDRMPFNRDHLKAINDYLERSNVSARNKSIIELIKLTGASGSELAGLEQRDVLLDADIPYIWIRPNSIRPRLKTEARTRKIPLLPDAKLALAKFKKDNSKEPLWGKIIEANSLSAALNKSIRKAVPKSPRLTVYSFRHSLEAAMRLAKVPFYHQQALMGHAKTSMTDKYGASQISLKKLLKSLKKAQKKLGVIEDSNYTEEELAGLDTWGD